MLSLHIGRTTLRKLNERLTNGSGHATQFSARIRGVGVTMTEIRPHVHAREGTAVGPGLSS